MRGRAEACRKKALECERRAVLATEDAARALYLDLVHQWREMAEQAEELERRCADAAAAEAQRRPSITILDYQKVELGREQLRVHPARKVELG